MKKPEVGRPVRALVIAVVQVKDNEGAGHVGVGWNRVNTYYVLNSLRNTKRNGT